MANGAWLWKLGLWGLVILFGFLYLGSVEWRSGDADRDSSVRPAPVAGSETAVDNVEPDVAQPVAELEESAATAVETTAAIEPAVLGGSGAPVSASPETAGGAVEYADGGPVSSAVSQAEAHAFAQAVLSDDGAEPGRPAVPVAAGESPEPAAVSEPIPETVTEAAIARTPAPPVAQPAVPSAASEPMPRVVEPAVVPVAAPVAASMPTPAVQPQAVIAQPQATTQSAAPARETAAQRRARIMAEYRAMRQAAREEMRRRWSRPGGSSPYGAYPQWGYPQGYPPRWGQPRRSRPGD